MEGGQFGSVPHPALGDVHSPAPVVKEEEFLYSLKITPKLCIQPDPSSLKHAFRTHI